MSGFGIRALRAFRLRAFKVSGLGHSGLLKSRGSRVVSVKVQELVVADRNGLILVSVKMVVLCARQT